jgi:integrase
MTSTDELAKAQMLLTQMQALGVEVTTLVALAAGEDVGEGVKVRSFVEDDYRPALTKGQRIAWEPYIKLMVDGYEHLCACFCPTCLAHYKGNSRWTPCPCVERGDCGCRRVDLVVGEVAAKSCLEHCAGLGERSLGSVRLSDWEQLGRWAQLRAQKRAAVRNANRGIQGRATFTHDGRSALEHLRNAASKLYKLALGDDVPGVRRNLAMELEVKDRPESEARAYSAEQLDELWQALFTSGGNDVELDMGLVWFILETGGRRGASIKMRMGDLLLAASRIRLHEKFNKSNEQPVSEALLVFLVSHALRRGNVVAQMPDGMAESEVSVADVFSGRVKVRTDAPVFYYQPKVVIVDDVEVAVPHPLTVKRFESLWTRLKRELPWLEEIHGRPHDLRKTMGTFVERAFGHAVAQRWLRHGKNNTTDLYTRAGVEEIEDAHRWLVGGGT